MFLLRPQIYYAADPSSRGKTVCNSQENGVRRRCAAVVDHYAIVDLLRGVNVLRRSIFGSTAGYFG